MDDISRLLEYWRHLGSEVVTSAGPTRRGERGEAALDYFVTPSHGHPRAWVSVQWYTESDHAWLSLGWRTMTNAGGTWCNPAMIKNLPEEAFIDLRLRYRSL
ncbi:MAG: hypothetical protein ACKPKO_13525, partial [Candidatus Fonsibacter sp.]